MSQLLESFEKTYVINLPNRADRRRALIHQFEQLGYDGDDPRIEIFPAVRPTEADGFPSVGKRGCFLSHYGVIRRAIEAGHRRILVMEDDCLLLPSMSTHGDALLKQLDDQPWDIAYLGHDEPWVRERPIGWHRRIERRQSFGTHLLAVQGECLDALAEYMRLCNERPAGHPEGGRMGADGTYEMFRKLHTDRVVLFCNPALAGQRKSRSDVTTTWFDRVPGLRTMAGWVRHVRGTRAGRLT